MPIDNMLAKLEIVRQAAVDAGVPEAEPIKIFLSSYQAHKDIHGSIFHSTDGPDDYFSKMDERYEFMKEQAVKYIEDQRKDL